MTRGVSVLAVLAFFLPALDSVASSAESVWQSSSAAAPDGAIVFRAVIVEDQDDRPAATGKAAAEKLKAALGGAPLQAVLVAECFEDLDRKRQLLQGVCSVIPPELVFGEATYGSFTQDGSAGVDSVCLLGIGGEGVSVAATLVTELGVAKLTFQEHEQEIKNRLHAAGAKLVGQLHRTAQDRLLLLIADAHSPKNQFLVEGAQQVVGGGFPITGGSANKNAGQTFVYFQGQPHSDSAVALLLSGNFRVALAGRKAMDNDQVLATAKEAATQVLAAFDGKPAAVLAFDCAGRRGKLRRPADELAAIQAALGKDLPLFGCYCAGEVGPLDVTEKPAGVLSGGGGGHVMFTVIGR
ncbi:MAG: FIST C-terminal domain-containing protein [Planctomycetota bacterium]|nr:FIST C-terminal domain-containing protein [Planctomycetota bacterium]